MKQNIVNNIYRTIDVRPVNGALGAEIEGVSLSEPLDNEVILEIRQAFLDHLVVFFHDQKLTPQEQLSFARQFGEPMKYPQLKGLPDCPLVTAVIKLEHEDINFGGVWHSDTTYLDYPPMASLLYAIEIPPTGGDTLFANQYLAYEALSKDLKIRLDNLLSVSKSTKPEVAKTRENRLHSDGAEVKVLHATHPVVRIHPETQRKALYINNAHTTHIKGLPKEESQSLLDKLFTHQVKPEFTFRFRWRQGSLAFWDNRCTQHNPVNDYYGFRRIMHRVTLAGDKPR